MPETHERSPEARLDMLEMQVKQIAPAAVHLAEVTVQYATIQRQQDDLRADLKSWIDRLDTRLDPLHTRLRRAEYALIALGLTLASPKIGGPDIAHSAATVIQTWLT